MTTAAMAQQVLSKSGAQKRTADGVRVGATTGKAQAEQYFSALPPGHLFVCAAIASLAFFCPVPITRADLDVVQG